MSRGLFICWWEYARRRGESVARSNSGANYLPGRRGVGIKKKDGQIALLRANLDEIINDHAEFRNFVDDQAKHIRALIVEYGRQLQILELQQARLGLAVPPHIILQIQDIRTKLEDLRREIKNSETRTGSLQL